MQALTSPTTLLLLLVAFQILICDRGKHGPERPGHSPGRPFALVGRRERDARDGVREASRVSCCFWPVSSSLRSFRRCRRCGRPRGQGLAEVLVGGRAGSLVTDRRRRFVQCGFRRVGRGRREVEEVDWHPWAAFHLTCRRGSAAEALGSRPARLRSGRGLLARAVSLREGWPRFGIRLTSVLLAAS